MTPEQQPATKQDLASAVAEIKTVVEASTAAMRGEFEASTAAMRGQFEASTAALREEFRERLDAAVVSVGADFSELRQEQRLRLEALERRLDRVSDSMAVLSAEIAAFNRWANRLDRDNADLRSTQIAQQRAVDDLVKRWTKGPQQ